MDHTNLSSDLSWICQEDRDDPSWSAFEAAIHGYAYGRDALHSAWHWFKTGMETMAIASTAAASEAVAPPEPVAVEWYPYPLDPCQHYALYDGPLEIEVHQTQAIAPQWYWEVSLGSGSFSLTGGVADDIDAAKAAAIAAARAWRDSIRL